MIETYHKGNDICNLVLVGYAVLKIVAVKAKLPVICLVECSEKKTQAKKGYNMFSFFGENVLIALFTITRCSFWVSVVLNFSKYEDT